MTSQTQLTAEQLITKLESGFKYLKSPINQRFLGLAITDVKRLIGEGDNLSFANTLTEMVERRVDDRDLPDYESLDEMLASSWIKGEENVPALRKAIIQTATDGRTREVTYSDRMKSRTGLPRESWHITEYHGRISVFHVSNRGEIYSLGRSIDSEETEHYTGCSTLMHTIDSDVVKATQ